MIELIRTVLAGITFTLALIFAVAGTAGLFRFPDPYSRLQAGSLCGTTAVFSVFLGCLFLAETWTVAARIIIIALFFLVSSPTGTHIVARFAWQSGDQPWRPEPKPDPSGTPGTPARAGAPGTSREPAVSPDSPEPADTGGENSP